MTFKDEDHNLISKIESALIDATQAIEDAENYALTLLSRNPDKAVDIQDVVDDLSSTYAILENTDFGEFVHDAFQRERGESYWERVND